MADNEKQTFKLDLDAKDFLENANQALQVLARIGDAKALSGLVEGLVALPRLLGIVAVAALAVKTALTGLDVILQAEAIEKINKQFELLAKNAGLAGDRLKAGLVEAVKGLADDTDVLQAASRSIAQMGAVAGRLPEIMDLARKTTEVFGGTLIDNFERISQAIARGNANTLRSIGLNVDADRAIRQYALSVNTVVLALSDQERKQAVLNAVLEKGRTAFAGISGDLTNATNSLTLLTTSLKQIAEIAILAWDRFAGDFVRRRLQGLAELLGDIKTSLTAAFGTGTEQAVAKVDVLSARSFELQNKLAELEDQLKKTDKAAQPEFFAYYTREIEITKRRIAETKAELASFGAVVAEANAKAGDVGKAPEDTEALEKRTAQQAKFHADLITLRLQRNKAELEAVETEKQAETLREQEIVLIREQANARMAEIDAQAALGETITRGQAAEMRVQIAAEAEARIRAIQRDAVDAQIADLERVAQAQQNTAQGFGAGFKAAAASAGRDMGNFAKLGQQAFTAFHKHASSSLMALGEGTKSASEIMRGFMFGALADIAQAQGQILLAQGFTGNFAAAAAGAALLVLAGFLRSMAQTTPKVPEGGTYGGTVSGGGYTSSLNENRPELQEQKPRREVTIQIMGHYFDTEGSRRALMEMIRQETDATDFRYVQIGQGA